MKQSSIGFKNSQNGSVSIIVTMVIIVIVSLIVTGFAQLTWREQRQSLDRQLSTQAFYAAETGVNDAVRAMETTPTLANAQKTDCAPDAQGWDIEPFLGTDGSVEITCVLVDPTPPELIFDRVDSSQSTVFVVRSADGQRVNSINFRWEPTDRGLGNACPNVGHFPIGSANHPWLCDTGVLRVDVVPLGGPFQREHLINRTFSAVFYPQPGGGGTIAYGSSAGTQAGRIVGGHCNNNGVCTVSVTGLSENTHYVRLQSIYRPSRVTVNAIGQGGGQVRLAGAQVVIDATGRASDVLRRIQTRVRLDTAAHSVPATEFRPDFPLQVRDGFCKRFAVAYPDSVSSDPFGVVCNPWAAGF